ncbi:RNA-directed DNA polymerase, eukaryota [Tanacetum coccineum]
MGTWIPTSTKLLIISIYAPQKLSEKRELWDFIHNMVERWEGEAVIMGDFNEVRTEHERFGTSFNIKVANAFNSFISMTGLMASFPHLSALCLDRHLSDHRPILMREMNLDYGPTSFRLFHSLFQMDGFDNLVGETWKGLKTAIKAWSKDAKKRTYVDKCGIKNKLSDIDKKLDQCRYNDETLNERSTLMKDLHDLESLEALEITQKAKVRWSIEGGENTIYFHGLSNNKRSQLEIREMCVDGEWIIDPYKVTYDFLVHFSNRFTKPDRYRIRIDFPFPNCLSSAQVEEMERTVSYKPYWSIYKIVSKILAYRLSFVIADIISEVQSAFVLKRQILDGPSLLISLSHDDVLKSLALVTNGVDGLMVVSILQWVLSSLMAVLPWSFSFIKSNIQGVCGALDGAVIISGPCGELDGVVSPPDE